MLGYQSLSTRKVSLHGFILLLLTASFSIHAGEIAYRDIEGKWHVMEETEYPQVTPRYPQQFRGGTIAVTVTYLDVENSTGVGFDDPTEGATRRALVESVISYLLTVLNHTGSLQVEFKESQTDGSGALASAGPFFSTGPNGFSNGFAFRHITTGSDPSGSVPDIQATVDFGWNWNATTAAPEPDQLDLFSVLLHELTHGLGILTLLSSTGNSRISGGNPGVFSVWDSLLQNGNGTDLMASGGEFVGSLTDLRGGNNGAVLTGNEATAANGTAPEVYTPTNFVSGSSISHWNTNMGEAVMRHSIGAGTERREYLSFELGALADLGYTVISNCTAPNINSNPQSGDLCPGNSTTLTVSASGSSLSYQWQLDGNDLSGETSSSLSLSNVDSSDAGSYTCVVGNSCGSVTSSAATITVGTTTVVTNDPDSLSLCPGNTAVFEVSASGSGLTFQWQRNGNDLSNETSSTLTIAGISEQDAGSYACVVSGDCGSDTSNVATLTVGTQTSISSQPQSATTCQGEDVTLSVIADGSNLTYQWQFNGSNLSGETSATLVISNASESDAGNYTCVVSGDCGSETSSTATLTLEEAVAIVDPPQAATVCEGADAAFSVTASGNNLTYQWFKSGNELSGETGSTLSLTAVSTVDEGSYTCQITGDCGTVITTPVDLNVTSGVTISQQPQSGTFCEGTTVMLTVAAEGSNLTYQWQKDQQTLAGETAATLQIDNFSSADEGSYFCVISSDCGSATSDSATLNSDLLPTLVQSPSSIAVCSGETAVLTSTFTGGNFDLLWFFNGEALPNEIGDTLTIQAADSASAGLYRLRATSSCGEVFSEEARLTVDGNLSVRVDPQLAAQGLGNLSFNALAACGQPPYSYRWLLDGVEISMEEGVVITPDLTVNATLTVEVTDSAQATASDSALVLVAPSNDPNGDGQNTIEDLFTVANDWLNSLSNFDADGNGVINIQDLLFVNIGN